MRKGDKRSEKRKVKIRADSFKDSFLIVSSHWSTLYLLEIGVDIYGKDHIKKSGEYGIGIADAKREIDKLDTGIANRDGKLDNLGISKRDKFRQVENSGTMTEDRDQRVDNLGIDIESRDKGPNISNIGIDVRDGAAHNLGTDRADTNAKKRPKDSGKKTPDANRATNLGKDTDRGADRRAVASNKARTFLFILQKVCSILTFFLNWRLFLSLDLFSHYFQWPNKAKSVLFPVFCSWNMDA